MADALPLAAPARRAPPALAIAAALGAAAGALHAAAPLPPLALPSAWGGALLAAAGALWLLWAAWRLRRAGNPVLGNAPPRVFVDDGPFAWNRHPMYLGAAAMLAGSGWALGAPALLAAALAFVLVVQRVHLPREEALLRQSFGAWYSDYASDVPRWF